MPEVLVAGATVGFGGAAFATTAVPVAVEGARFVLGANAGLAGSAPRGLTSASLGPSRFAVASGLGAILDGQVTLALTFEAGAVPSLTLSDLSGGAPTAARPGPKGPALQALTPGTPMPLDGLGGP